MSKTHKKLPSYNKDLAVRIENGPSCVIDSLRAHRGGIHTDKRDKRNKRANEWKNYLRD